MFTNDDLKQLQKKGITKDVAERQLEYFKDGFPYLRLVCAATVGNGILRFNEQEINNWEQVYSQKLGQRKVFKFVPASGAATRMFKDLYEFIQKKDDSVGNSVNEVFEHLNEFAFCPELKQILGKQSISECDRKKIAEAILLNNGLNYGNLPKGMLLFHKYADDARTALEEHLVEGAQYAQNADGSVNLHFTVSPEHQQGFEALVNKKQKKYADLFGTKYNVSFSQQKSSTDILAVDNANQPVRNADGTILFRPGGHGALLENLNDIDADIIFIKNIDNVSPDSLKPITVKYKKALAGLLLDLQEQTAKYLQLLHEDKLIFDEVLNFLSSRLFFHPHIMIQTWTNTGTKNYLIKILNRPIRVCGMVRNEGEPGGGPFWVRNVDGSASLQIAESTQIDMNDAQQKQMAEQATHFNPVDLVCAVKDSNGKRFNLLEYRNPNTGFISKKSKDGIELKAQELPGLWNGAMANWNTVFVEVPIETFNPVKTINDLLKPQHQGSI